MKSNIRGALVIIVMSLGCMIASCGSQDGEVTTQKTEKQEKYMDYLPHPTRAEIIGPGRDAYVGETVCVGEPVTTSLYSIWYTASGIYQGKNEQMKKTKERKYIYMEYEVQSYAGKMPSAEDFYVMIEGEKHEGVTAPSERDPEEASKNQKRRRVYFEVPLRTDTIRICLKESEEAEEVYYFLWEGSFSIDAVRK